MTTAIAIHGETMPVQSVADLQTVGQLIAQSGLLGAQNPAEGFLIAATCHQTGTSLLEFGQTYHVFQGKISMKADAMVARFNELGGTHRVIARTPELVSIEVTFNGVATEMSLSWDEVKQEPFVYRGGPAAQMAELDKPFESRNLKDKYKTPRARMQMMWARLVSDVIRCVCPQANRGSYAPEEVADFNDKPRSGMDPIVISPEEVQSRVIDTVSSDVRDYGVCPIDICDCFGKPWADVPFEVMKKVYESTHSSVTDTHRVEIGNEVTRRNPA
jgi:hypothetical protein